VRKTITIILVLFAVSRPFWAMAQDAQGFTIRFFDQKVYFLGDPIQVEAVLTNTGTDTLRFKVADNRFYNLDFDVRTTTNVGLGHAKEFTIERNSDQPVFFREVALQPGEKYGITIDLTSYAAFASAGQYVVQAIFFPELFRGPDSATLTSNRLTLNVKPPVATAEEKAMVEAETGALLARQALPPDETVSWTIAARQKSQWERFFLYLDLETLMRKNPDKDRVFRNSTETAQRKMVDQYRQQLMQTTILQDISVIPSSFTVQKTSYDASEATVQVLEKFKYTDYTELKAYTYHLKKSDRYWIIYDYEIKNQGTE
jgi:hypothetical protein